MVGQSFLNRVLVILLAVVLNLSGVVFAGSVTVDTTFPTTGVQSQNGGATVQTVETTASTQSTTEVVTDLVTLPSENNSVGFGITFSSHIKAIKIPLSYTWNKKLKLTLTLPYIEKNLKGAFGGTDLTDKGLGDVSTGVKYTKTAESYRLVSTFVLKLPTGNDKQFENGKERLALGTGSYDFIWGESAIFKSSKWESIRWIGGVSYRYNGSSDYTEAATIGGTKESFNFKNRNGNSLTLFGGFSKQTGIPKLIYYANVSALLLWASHEEYSNASKSVNVNQDKDDSMTAVDIIPGIKYQFSSKSSARLGAVIPVSTGYDPDVTDTKAREVTIDFGIDKVF